MEAFEIALIIVWIVISGYIFNLVISRSKLNAELKRLDRSK
ncbi:MAG: CcmD family protein [Methanosarcinaceae archaeon]|nr:CcmD family protein [Methanosarcinaceae archaeon]